MSGDHKINKALLVNASLLISIISACNSPQAQEKNREELLEKFVSGAVEHMMDRNPETIQQSMTILTRDEMTEKLVERLQNQKLIPETDISVLKIVDESKASHSSNTVTVASVTPVSPIMQPEVRFHVVGSTTDQTNGKPGATHPFDFNATCQLTEAMDGFPRLTDLTSAGASAKESETTAAGDAHSRTKRRGHHR